MLTACNLCNTKYYIEDSNKRYELIKVDSVSDLGLRFDSKVAVLDHMKKLTTPIVC